MAPRSGKALGVPDAAVREIPLVGGRHSHGRVAVVDAADYPELAQFQWRALRGGGGHTFYALRQTGARTIYMHRQLMGLRGPPVDHIDGDGLNNRRSNLRHATAEQNRANRRKRGKQRGSYSSKYKGVCLPAPRWLAFISHLGKMKHLGAFKTEEEAARAYDRAAKELFGEFASLNFPERGERR